MLYPLTMVCCGCRVAAGAYIIMVSHLVACCFFIFSACSVLLYKAHGLAASFSPMEQLFGVGWSLIGVTLIIGAIYGVARRIEMNVRLYLYYFLICFVSNVVQLARAFLMADVCQTTGKILLVASESFGEAFMCGAMRIFSYFFVAGAVLTEAYCLWVIWSLCEDVHFGQMGPELAELIPSKADFVQKLRRQKDGPYADIVGLAHAKVPGPYPNPAGYEAVNTIGMPGQSTIFGGNFHETNYPPSPQSGVF